MTTKPSWKRFSLRTGMLLVTAICFWLGWRAYVAKLQAGALDQLRLLGGHAQTETTQPSFFDKLAGNEESINGANVTDVNFLGPKSGDAEIDEIVRCVALLPNLERITLTDTALTRMGEQKLQAALPKLEIKFITTAFELESTNFNR